MHSERCIFNATTSYLLIIISVELIFATTSCSWNYNHNLLVNNSLLDRIAHVKDFFFFFFTHLLKKKFYKQFQRKNSIFSEVEKNSELAYTLYIDRRTESNFCLDDIINK